ncbi:MAG: outer membrane beta-barrel protein [Pseudomonadota bacterium]
MSFTRTMLLGAALAAGITGSASAADLSTYAPKGGSLKDTSYMPAIATQPSWYVRLDGAYAVYDTPVMVEQGIDTLTETDLDSSFAFGGGIGKYMTSTLRADINYERRFEADARGSLNHSGATLPGERRFGLKSDLFMANLYYDIDRGNRFNPYIGIGLGAVRHKTTEGTVESCGCTTGIVEEGENWSVAGALMAGFSLKLRSRFHLDAGYRFLYLGHAETGPVRTTGGTTGTQVSEDPTVEDIHAHEVRVGLRYDIR